MRGRPAGRRRRWPALAALALTSLALNTCGITWGLPNGERDWANDSVAPLGPVSYVRRLLDGAPWSSKYPPFHFTVLAGLYAPYALILWTRGQVVGPPTGHYPYGLADPDRALMTLTLIARSASAVMGAGTALAVYAATRALHGHRAGLVAGLLVATSYPVVHYAHNANVDVPQLFWLALALWSFALLLRTHAARSYALLGVFVALATATKDSALALGVGLGLSALWAHLQRRGRAGAPPLGRLAWGAGAFAVALLLAFNVPLDPAGVAGHVRFHLGRSVAGSKVIEAAASPWQGELALIGRYVDYLVQSNGALPFALLAGGVVFGAARAPGRTLLLGLPVLTYYLLFLRVHGTHHVRYVMPVLLLLAVPAGRAAAVALRARGVRRPLAGAALAVVLGASVVHGAAVARLYARDPRYAAEAWMRAHLPPGALVLAVRPDYTLPRFPDHLRVVRRDLWDWNGDPIGDFADLRPDYVVVGTRHRIAGHEARVARTLAERGYRPAATFTSSPPFLAAEVPDIHVINPRIVVFGRAGAGRGEAR